ncbi:MAG: hypothetical protein AB7I79_18335 [Rhizobiaceae bacterium]
MPDSMETAPRDGREVTVMWRSRDGVENTSLAHYRAGPGGSGGAWWTFTDSDTLKRIEPHSWVALGDEDP